MRSRKQGKACLIFGDFNVIVSTPTPGDDHDALVPQGIGERNERGRSFQDSHDVEPHNSINKAWREFAIFRQGLTDKEIFWDKDCTFSDLWHSPVSCIVAFRVS